MKVRTIRTVFGIGAADRQASQLVNFRADNPTFCGFILPHRQETCRISKRTAAMKDVWLATHPTNDAISMSPSATAKSCFAKASNNSNGTRLSLRTASTRAIANAKLRFDARATMRRN